MTLVDLCQNACVAGAGEFECDVGDVDVAEVEVAEAPDDGGLSPRPIRLVATSVVADVQLGPTDRISTAAIDDCKHVFVIMS